MMHGWTVALYFNLHPLSLFEAHGCKNKPWNLIAEDAHPDSDDAEAKRIPQEVGNDGTDDGDADGRGNRGVQSITGTPQAAHVNNLGNLENDDKDNHVHDVDANLDNLFVLKEKAKKNKSSL